MKIGHYNLFTKKCLKGDLPQNISILKRGHIYHINSYDIGGLKGKRRRIGRYYNFSYLLDPETMSPFHVLSKVCMAPFHVLSKVGIAQVSGTQKKLKLPFWIFGSFHTPLPPSAIV